VDIENYNFNYKELIDHSINKKYTSILNFFTTITTGFRKVFNFSILKKILLIGFFISGAFIMYSISTFFAATIIRDDLFVKYNKNYLTVDIKKINLDDYLKYEKSSNILYILPGDSIASFNVSYDDFYQTSQIIDSLKGSITTLKAIDSKNLIYGRMPDNENEIVVDKLTIMNMYKNNYALMAGYLDVEDMINKIVTMNNMPDFKIVGITDLNSPSIYMHESLLINTIHNSSDGSYYRDNHNNDEILDYNLIKDEIEIKEGKLPLNDYEVIVNILNKPDMPLNKTIDTEINGVKLKVVGYYFSKENLGYYLVNSSTIKNYLVTTRQNMTIYPKDKNLALDEFREYNLNINDSYESSKKEFINNRNEFVTASLLVSSIILSISLIEIFLMIRSSFLSRIKEIGIYRAIGVKKTDIYKMFIGEIFAITTLASLPGLLLMAYILDVLSNIQMLANNFVMNYNIIMLSIIITYSFNLIIGLIPVYNVVKKTPAEILARHDID
ncbi:MAG TPA: ABC transporter permease, partial [Tenericutes bacterium]|nr:ABC transporter permease [Mycoplasmatota bacterium]